MSIRVAVLSMVVAFLAVYAWRDWFKALCGLIVLMAVIEHEDMPRSIAGIQGLNPWNILMASIVLAWLVHRRREGLTWDMPRHVTALLLLYLGVILIGFARAVWDRGDLVDYPLKSLFSEELINTLKWVIPGVLLFDGCRSRRRVHLAVFCLLAMYLLLAVQVAKRIPPASVFEGGAEIHQVRLKLCRSIGYSSVEMSTMLAGAAWAMAASLPLFPRRWQKGLVVGAAGLTTYAMALTGGRAGYLAWAVVGLVLCFLKWRKWLLLAPAVPVLAFLVFPGAADRALSGFGEIGLTGAEVVDEYVVTSGRTLVWPYVVERIGEAPGFGYGRLAMVRIGLTQFLLDTFGEGEALPHPHNAYLECLLDNGVLGALPILLFYGLVVYYSARLFRERHEPWRCVVGGMALCLVLAQLVAGAGSQHFYPNESTLGMWAAVFLMLRVWAEHSRVPGTAIARVPAPVMPRGLTAPMPPAW